MKHGLNTENFASVERIRVSSVFNLWLEKISLLLPVNLFWRFELRFSRSEACAVAFDRAEKARLVAFVTGRADLFDLNQQRIAVAIERHVLHLLRGHAPLAL